MPLVGFGGTRGYQVELPERGLRDEHREFIRSLDLSGKRAKAPGHVSTAAGSARRARELGAETPRLAERVELVVWGADDEPLSRRAVAGDLEVGASSPKLTTAIE